MGWSCAKAASDTIQAWVTACRKSTGSQNTWEENGRTFFFEHSRREHQDGAVTGSIFEIVRPDVARRRGVFRVDGDGRVARAPAFLKNAVMRKELPRVEQ